MALEIYQDETGDDAGEWRWRTKADNGRVTAEGESYKREEGAEGGVLSAFKTILESDLDGVFEAVVDYIEDLAAKGLLVLPGNNGGFVGEKPSAVIGTDVAKFVKSWIP